MEVAKERGKKVARAYCSLHSKFVASKNTNTYQKCGQVYLITPHLFSILKRDHEVHGSSSGEKDLLDSPTNPKSRKIPECVLGAMFTYWFQKKENNHFLPLLQRLQTQVESEKLLVRGGRKGDKTRSDVETFLSLVNLRRDLDRGRLMIDLIRKRERLKRDYLTNLQSIFAEECSLVSMESERAPGEQDGARIEKEQSEGNTDTPDSTPFLPSVDGYCPSSPSSFFSQASGAPCWPLPSAGGKGSSVIKWWELGFREPQTGSTDPSPARNRGGFGGRTRKLPMVRPPRPRKRKERRAETKRTQLSVQSATGDVPSSSTPILLKEICKEGGKGGGSLCPLEKEQVQGEK